MFEVKHFNHLNHIKKEPFFGSMDGMRYMLAKETEGEESVMSVAVWPEPFCYAKTPEEQKIKKRFTLDDSGMAEAVDWLNGQYGHFKKD